MMTAKMMVITLMKSLHNSLPGSFKNPHVLEWHYLNPTFAQLAPPLVGNFLILHMEKKTEKKSKIHSSPSPVANGSAPLHPWMPVHHGQ